MKTEKSTTAAMGKVKNIIVVMEKGRNIIVITMIRIISVVMQKVPVILSAAKNLTAAAVTSTPSLL